MANPGGVAEGALPGTVLSPNADVTSLQDSHPLDQFGHEAPRPDAGSNVNTPKANEDPKRFEYWQAQAQKAENEKKEALTQLAEKSKYDPLIDVIRSDDETLKFVQSRLNGQRAPVKPLEPPQRPNSYNEVEAYQNPDSPSFKYRKANETYRDTLLQSTIEMQNRFLQEQENQKALAEQQRTHQEGLRKFHDDVLGKGINEPEFAEFFQLVNQASVDDMVGYYRYKQSQGQQRQIPNGGIGGGGNPSRDGKANPNDMFSQEVLNNARRMR